jgi:hypothetical protein
MTARRIYSMMELQAEYKQYLQTADTMRLDLGAWLPSLRKARPLVPGELAFILADTGCGKSMALQCVAASTVENILFFELELPKTMMFERFMALAHQKTCSEIEAHSKENAYWATAAVGHVWMCDDTRLNTGDMMDTIDKAEETMGARPPIVMVDYIGLMSAQGKSRYERMSVAAEDLKVLAKEANVIVVAATQRSRPDRGESDSEVTLHDSKDSGSIENSCGLLLGMWKTGVDSLKVRVLKNSKGPAGWDIECNMDGARMSITERATGVESNIGQELDDYGYPIPA